MIPRVLRNFNVFVNGVGYAGRVTEATLPEFSIKTDEHRAGGMDAPAEIDMGMDAMTAKLTFAEYVPEILTSFGQMDGNAVRIQLRGALQRDGEAAVPMVVELHGGQKKNGLGNWKAGDPASNEIDLSVRYAKVTIAGSDMIEIDVDNMKRVVGGVDVLASIRAAIGI